MRASCSFWIDRCCAIDTRSSSPYATRGLKPKERNNWIELGTTLRWLTRIRYPGKLSCSRGVTITGRLIPPPPRQLWEFPYAPL
ncbi:hypothetical protein D9M70_588420 [compost metagenome]